jgi:tetraacyldisaccharide 4'-kinase
MNLIRPYKIFRFLLTPLIPVYLIIYNINKLLGKEKTFNIPVVCIGNITTGGTGKTPAVIEIAKILSEMGYHPGIVCRGYRGSDSKAGAIVSNGSTIFSTPGQSGDEPFLIAKSLKNIPIAICSNRIKAIYNLTRRYKTDIILMDDGFQNFSIKKNISIVIVDATNPFGNGLILPAGDLREPKFALKRSDVIMINKSDLISAGQLTKLNSKISQISNNKKIINSYYINEFLYHVNNPEKRIQLSYVKNKKILLITGIANPDSFEIAVKKYSPESIKIKFYPDHHIYNYKEVLKWINESENFDLVISTEKDYVKLTDFQFNDKFYILKIVLKIDEISKFKNIIKSLLKNSK